MGFVVDSSIHPWIRKSPGDVLDYVIDGAANGWLAEGETILDVVWVTDLTVEAANHTDTVAVVWLSGGEAGERHTVIYTVTTSAARTYSRTFEVRIENL